MNICNSNSFTTLFHSLCTFFFSLFPSCHLHIYKFLHFFFLRCIHLQRVKKRVYNQLLIYSTSWVYVTDIPMPIVTNFWKQVNKKKASYEWQAKVPALFGNSLLKIRRFIKDMLLCLLICWTRILPNFAFSGQWILHAYSFLEE